MKTLFAAGSLIGAMALYSYNPFYSLLCIGALLGIMVVDGKI